LIVRKRKITFLRIYSVKGLMDRLTGVGFYSKLETYEEVDNNKYGYKTNEKVIIAEKP